MWIFDDPRVKVRNNDLMLGILREWASQSNDNYSSLNVDKKRKNIIDFMVDKLYEGAHEIHEPNKEQVYRLVDAWLVQRMPDINFTGTSRMNIFAGGKRKRKTKRTLKINPKRQNVKRRKTQHKRKL